ncbi:hypothetical protein [Subtercola frigoramans]|uniref:Uncharacterized protein n=1 Tax=Subtercola frigoramans TaxID=120298 RepID=A0ABS2L7X4_9MICO|nr:hypothetical protein [Subtercola frigoramans]
MWKPGSTVIRPWLTALVILLGLAAAVLGAPHVVEVWNDTAHPGRSKGFFLATLTVLPLGLITFGTMKGMWDWRLGLLARRRPGAIVSTVIRARTTSTGMAMSRGDVNQLRLPASMALVADSIGVELWGGIARPEMLWSSRWEDVLSIDPGSERFGSGRGRINVSLVIFVVRSEFGQASIAVGPIGSKYGGFLRARPLEALKIADALSDLRRRSVRHFPG